LSPAALALFTSIASTSRIVVVREPSPTLFLLDRTDVSVASARVDSPLNRLAGVVSEDSSASLILSPFILFGTVAVAVVVDVLASRTRLRSPPPPNHPLVARPNAAPTKNQNAHAKRNTIDENQPSSDENDDVAVVIVRVHPSEDGEVNVDHAPGL
jgi:hypothetical protein